MKAAVLTAVAAASLAAAGCALGQTPANVMPPQIEHGKQLFQYWCAPCHGAGIGLMGAKNLPGTTALAAKYKGEKPALLEERTDLTPELVRYFVRKGLSIMPYFRKTEVSDEALDDIAAYLCRRNR